MKKYDDEDWMIDHYGEQSLYKGETVFKDDYDFSTVEIKHLDNMNGSNVLITRTSYDCVDEEHEENSIKYTQLYTVSPVIQKSRFILSNGYPVAVLNHIDNDHYKLNCSSAFNHVFYSEHFGQRLSESVFPFFGCGSLSIDIERTVDGFRFFAFGDLIAKTAISEVDDNEVKYYDNEIKVSVTDAVKYIEAFAVFPIHDIIFTPDASQLKEYESGEPDPRIDDYDDATLNLDMAGNEMLKHMLHLKTMCLCSPNGDNNTLVWSLEPVIPEFCLKEPYYKPYDEFSLMRMGPDGIKKLYQTEKTRRILLGMDLNELRDEFSLVMNKDQQIYFDFY